MSVLALLLNVLLVGQSPGVEPLAPQLELALRQQQREARVEALGLAAPTLAQQWMRLPEADGAAGRPALAAGEVDALILVDALPAGPPGAADPDTHEAARRFHALATGTNPAAAVFLVAPPPGPPLAAEAWAAAAAERLEAARGLVDALNAARPEGSPPVRLAPVGTALAEVGRRAAAGQVPGLEGPADLVTPEGRLNDRGEYVLALTLFATLTGRSPEGKPERLRRLWTTRAVVVTPPMAAAIQAAVRTVVEAEAARPVAAADPAADPAAVPAAVQRAAAADAFPPVLVPPPEPEIRHPNLAIGLSSVNDFSPAQPFVDVFKTARTWTGHLPGQYGGWGHDDFAAGGWLDAQGWLRGIPPELTHVSALILTDLPADAAATAGRYRVTWCGRGEIRLQGAIGPVERRGNELWFDFAPKPGPVFIELMAIDPADPIRDIAVVREANIPAFEAGEIFDPLWLSRLRGLRMLRFMDWAAVNNSRLATSADRPRPDDYTWTRNGVPIEVQVALANRLGADPWFNIPHLADDALIREYATIVRDTLDAGLVAHVELSNEVWNWQFEQAHWAEREGLARWGAPGRFAEFYALRATEMGRIWAEVFGAAAETRLVRILATQTGWHGLEELILNAPAWAREAGPGFVPPWQEADAYAITGYFSGLLGGDEKAPIVRGWIADSRRAAEADARARGLTGAAWAGHVERHRFDLAVALAAQELADGSVTRLPGDSVRHTVEHEFAYHAGVARRHGLRLMMYEGGTHVVGTGRWMEDEELTRFFVHFNFTPEMGALYRKAMAGWARFSDAPFMNFGDVFAPGRWGSWGALRHSADDNPRWRAMIAAP